MSRGGSRVRVAVHMRTQIVPGHNGRCTLELTLAVQGYIPVAYKTRREITSPHAPCTRTPILDAASLFDLPGPDR